MRARPNDALRPGVILSTVGRASAVTLALRDGEPPACGPVRRSSLSAALAWLPPVAWLSPPLPVGPPLVSPFGLLSVLVFDALSPESVFSADFVLLASDF